MKVEVEVDRTPQFRNRTRHRFSLLLFLRPLFSSLALLPDVFSASFSVLSGEKERTKKQSPHLSDLGQRHLHAPELALVAQAKLADELELGVEALLLERAARLLEGLAD